MEINASMHERISEAVAVEYRTIPQYLIQTVNALVLLLVVEPYTNVERSHDTTKKDSLRKNGLRQLKR